MGMDNRRSKAPKKANEFNERNKIRQGMNSTGERGQDVDIDTRQGFGFVRE
jgi:hypothetical protein